jgi:hypothetical protein
MRSNSTVTATHETAQVTSSPNVVYTSSNDGSSAVFQVAPHEPTPR